MHLIVGLAENNSIYDFYKGIPELIFSMDFSEYELT